MSPDRMAGAAWWASGGTVAGRRGPIALDRAVELLGFFNSEAEMRLGEGDAVAARFCADQALEIGCALAKATLWRRCSGVPAPPI